MTLLTPNPVEHLPLSETRQFGEKLTSIAPKDLSDAFTAVVRYIENAVFLPLLRSKTVQELDLQVDLLLPFYTQYSRVMTGLVFLAFGDQYRLLEKYAREALDEIKLFIESKAPEKLSETATLNSLAAMTGIEWVSDELWHRVLENASSLSSVPIERFQRAEEFSVKTWLYLNCILHHLDGKVVSVDQSILEELAYRARDNAQSWYATINQMGLITKPEIEVPESIETDEEDSWLAEAGLEDYLKQLDQ